MKRITVFLILIFMAVTTVFYDAGNKEMSFAASEDQYENFAKDFGVKVLKEECIDDLKTFYGFIEGENRYIFVDGKKVNIQVAYSNGVITVGYPVILGGY